MNVYTVEARFDEEAGVWYVCKSDVPGLATEAATVEELLAKLKVMVPELLDCNGELQDSDGIREVPFDLIAHASMKASLASFA